MTLPPIPPDPPPQSDGPEPAPTEIPDINFDSILGGASPPDEKRRR